ncbi:MAG: hypothetical protein ACYDC8_07680 [Gammaproteobacteria bacterium]
MSMVVGGNPTATGKPVSGRLLERNDLMTQHVEACQLEEIPLSSRGTVVKANHYNIRLEPLFILPSRSLPFSAFLIAAGQSRQEPSMAWKGHSLMAWYSFIAPLNGA